MMNEKTTSGLTMPTPEQIKEVKARGFLHNRGTSQFSGRIITENGVLTASQMRCMSEAAEKFGSGDIAFTVRMTVEVPGIDFDNIQPFCDYIARENLKTGGTGAKVRPVVSCKGTTCVFGLYDTQAMATEIHQRFFVGYGGVKLPHKFKIAVGGCPNNCAKPDLNDVGIVGQRPPDYDLDACRGCKTCRIETTCPMNAASVVDKKIQVNPEICNNCGRCYDTCTFDITRKNETMYRMYIGGRWGKKIRIGTQLPTLFTHDEALDMVEKALLLFRSQGKPGERFGETIDRIGVEKTVELLSGDGLLQQKSDILAIAL